LQANLIGQLETIKGTVTRTSIVRPELLLGTFQCTVCKDIYADIPQQFAYTPVYNEIVLN
jgi:DNA replication licensing factor MCM6